MPEVNFVFSREADLKNLHRVCNARYSWGDPSKGISQEILNIAKGRSFEECKNELGENRKKIYESPIIPVFLKSANDAWRKIGDEYFKRLENIMKKPICAEKFTGRLTTVGRCPYNTEDNSFMVGLFYSIPAVLECAGHEIMHLHFHKYFWDNIEQQIGYERTDDLKESLTKLLDLEFKDLWFVNDGGYEYHKNLRDFIAKEWAEHKDFEKLLENCVHFIRNSPTPTKD